MTAVFTAVVCSVPLEKVIPCVVIVPSRLILTNGFPIGSFHFTNAWGGTFPVPSRISLISLLLHVLRNLAPLRRLVPFCQIRLSKLLRIGMRPTLLCETREWVRRNQPAITVLGATVRANGNLHAHSPRAGDNLVMLVVVHAVQRAAFCLTASVSHYEPFVSASPTCAPDFVLSGWSDFRGHPARLSDSFPDGQRACSVPSQFCRSGPPTARSFSSSRLRSIVSLTR